MRILSSLCCLLLTANVLFAQADKDKKKWDVSNPEGIPYSNVEFTVTEGTWMNLDVSPDGKTIAFDLLGDIYTIPVSGGNATCIRSGLPWEVQPRFSPDGTQILFTSDAGGGDNIWLSRRAVSTNPKLSTITSGSTTWKTNATSCWTWWGSYDRDVFRPAPHR